MGSAAFKAARDFLFANRADYRAAHAGFQWPQLDHFNYALDWFDAELARGENADGLALKIVGDGAGSATFAELSASSNRIANGLRALGVKRGERILLMLGKLKIFCRSRTAAPSSICAEVLPNRLGSLA